MKPTLNCNPYSEDDILCVVESIEAVLNHQDTVTLNREAGLLVCERLRTLLNMEQYFKLTKGKY